jgi:hypothetical protein
MVVVIPGVLFMMQYAFVDPVACIEKNSNPLSRSRSMTRGLRKSLLGFIFPWAVFSQISGLVTLQFSDNFLSLISLNIFTQTLYFFILCGFFCAYEYRSYQIATRRAQKEESPLPHRPLTNKKTSPALGWFAFIAIFAGCGFLISQSLQKKNYASCISKTVQDSFNASTPTSSSFNVKSICESAKNTCVATSEPPCAVSCNLTKYNVVHPKDKSKPFTIQGFPNITECMQ